MLQRISQEDSVDVFGFVRQMRYQRNFMVQTEVWEIDDESPKNVKNYCMKEPSVKHAHFRVQNT